MRAAACFLAALVLLAAACTFEPRSPDDADPGSAGPPGRGSTGTPDTPSAAPRGVPAGARAALEAFQEARRTGDRAAVRARLAEDAVVLWNARTLAWRGGSPAADTLLGPASSRAEWEEGTEGRALGDGVLFVLRYAGGGSDAPRVLETLLLTPGAGGWRVSLLHRSTAH